MTEKWKNLCIYKKAIEMQKLVDCIVESVEKTDIDFEHRTKPEMVKHNLNYLKKNALIIPAKIAGVADKDIPYDIKMENAAIIRKSARELITDLRGIQMHYFKDVEYLDLLRNEVEEFRILFAEWVKTFDCWNYIIDISA